MNDGYWTRGENIDNRHRLGKRFRAARSMGAGGWRDANLELPAGVARRHGLVAG
jgi:hypothetical protein